VTAGYDALGDRGPGLYLVGLSAADAEQHARARCLAVVVDSNGGREYLGSVPVHDPGEFESATVLGPVPLGDSDPAQGPDPALESDPAPAPWPEVERRLAARLARATELLAEVEPGRDYAYLSHEARELVEAVQRVRALQPEPPAPAHLLDEDAERRITASVWTALADGGHSTLVSDAAVEAVRRALEAER
jgi:hypothetical protein